MRVPKSRLKHVSTADDGCVHNQWERLGLGSADNNGAMQWMSQAQQKYWRKQHGEDPDASGAQWRFEYVRVDAETCSLVKCKDRCNRLRSTIVGFERGESVTLVDTQHDRFGASSGATLNDSRSSELGATRAIYPRGDLRLGGRAPDVLGPRPLRSLADIEFDGVSLAQIIEAFAKYRALMEEVVLAPIVLDKAESLIDADRSDRSIH